MRGCAVAAHSKLAAEVREPTTDAKAPTVSADEPKVKVDNVINNCFKLLRNYSLIPRKQSRYLSITNMMKSVAG
jgi:hypothetical protein